MIDEARYLLEGFNYGFRIPAVGKHRVFCANLRSVKGMESIVWKKISKEVKEGWVFRPLP